MLKINLDEGAVFDIYSIYHVKYNFADSDDKRFRSYEAMTQLKKEIKGQIGDELFTRIINSDEYAALYEANCKTFDLVDEARSSKGLAKKVDKANMERYNRKVALQKRFFDSAPFEIKTDEQKSSYNWREWARRLLHGRLST